MMTMTAACFLTHAHADDLGKYISVTNAWVQAMPPAQTSTAAYMTITNDSALQAVLTSASSDIAGAVEIHQMSEANGMMKMAMVPNISIPSKLSVTLKPGGFHIMLINLKKSVNKGDIVPITLHFQDGSDIVVKAEVKAQQEDNSSSMPGMQM